MKVSALEGPPLLIVYPFFFQMSRGVVCCDFCRCDSKLRRVFSRTCRYCHIRVSGCGVCLASDLVVIDFSRRRYQCVDRSDDSQCRRATQAALRSASANDEDDDDEVIGPSIARDDGQGDDQGDDDDDDDDNDDDQGDGQGDDEDEGDDQGDDQGDDDDDDEDEYDPNEYDRVEFITVSPREDRGTRRMNRAAVVESMETEQSQVREQHEHVTKLKRELAAIERLQTEVFNEMRGCKMHRCTVCHE